MLVTIILATLLAGAVGTNVALIKRLRRMVRVIKRLGGRSDEQVLSYLELSAPDSFVAQKLLAAASTIDVQPVVEAHTVIVPPPEESYDHMVEDIKRRGPADDEARDVARLETLNVWLDRRPVHLTESRLLDLEELFSNYKSRKLVRQLAFEYMEKHS